MEKTGISLYPNPVVDNLNIESTDDEPFRFILYDINGKLITDLKISSSQTINLSNVSSGVYIGYIWKEQNRIQHVKIIKK